MAYSAAAVATPFIDKAKRGEIKDLTPMKLQKIVVLYSVVASETIQRKHYSTICLRGWPYGPVIPHLYHMLKKYGSNLKYRK